MALIHCDFYSEVLGISTSMDVILPQNTYSQIGMKGSSFSDKHPTLYLLHGMSDDHTIWQRRTAIERYVASLGIAVVMPNVQRSYYTDMFHGQKFWTFVSEELLSISRSFFPLSDLREDNFVAGLSMGGYGAFKMALRCPEKFIAGASLSGAVDAVSIYNLRHDDSELNNIFGSVDMLKGSENDLFYLADKVDKSNSLKPMLYQCCGTEDFLYKDNKRFKEFCNELSINLTYEEEQGEHDWSFWDKYIQNVLNWLPIKNRKI